MVWIRENRYESDIRIWNFWKVVERSLKLCDCDGLSTHDFAHQPRFRVGTERGSHHGCQKVNVHDGVCLYLYCWEKGPRLTSSMTAQKTETEVYKITDDRAGDKNRDPRRPSRRQKPRSTWLHFLIGRLVVRLPRIMASVTFNTLNAEFSPQFSMA